MHSFGGSSHKFTVIKKRVLYGILFNHNPPQKRGVLNESMLAFSNNFPVPYSPWSGQLDPVNFQRLYNYIYIYQVHPTNLHHLQIVAAY